MNKKHGAWSTERGARSWERGLGAGGWELGAWEPGAGDAANQRLKG
jgi:hypothetical protein